MKNNEKELNMIEQKSMADLVYECMHVAGFTSEILSNPDTMVDLEFTKRLAMFVIETCELVNDATVDILVDGCIQQITSDSLIFYGYNIAPEKLKPWYIRLTTTPEWKESLMNFRTSSKFNYKEVLDGLATDGWEIMELGKLYE